MASALPELPRPSLAIHILLILNGAVMTTLVLSIWRLAVRRHRQSTILRDDYSLLDSCIDKDTYLQTQETPQDEESSISTDFDDRDDPLCNHSNRLRRRFTVNIGRSYFNSLEHIMESIISFITRWTGDSNSKTALLFAVNEQDKHGSVDV
jgi:hypothetical protein